MKFDLIIKDATTEEVANVMSIFRQPVAAVSVSQVAVEAVEDEGVPSDGSGLDTTGVPWDARIHQSNKKKTAKGVWNRKKNLDDAYFNQIHSELKGTPAPVAPAPITFTSPVVNTAPVVPVPVFEAPSPVAPVQVFEAPAPVAPVAPAQVFSTPPVQVAPPQVSLPVADYDNLLRRAQYAFTTGKLNPTGIANLVNALNSTYNVNCQTITDVQGNDVLIQAAHQILTQNGCE